MSTFKHLCFYALLFVSAGCGKFGFSSRVAFQANIAEAQLVTFERSVELGFGGCSPLVLNAWAAPSTIGGMPAGVTMKLAGLRSGDRVFLDSSCRSAGNPNALPVPFAATKVTYYVKSAAMGSVKLKFSSSRFPEVAEQVIGVRLVATSIQFTVPSNSFSVAAGLCYGPVPVQIRDANGDPFIASMQELQIQNGEGVAYSDSVCQTAIPASGFKVINSSTAQVYFKKASVSSGPLALTLKDPKQAFIPGDTINVSFSSAPYKVRLVAESPATRVTLGVCAASPLKVELLDVDGNLTAPPAGGAVTVDLQGDLGSVAVFRTSCGAMGVPVTQLTFSDGARSQLVYVEARTRVAVNLKALVKSSQILPGTLRLDVDTLPVALSLSGPSSAVAGSVATLPFVVTLVDGLQVAIPATAAMEVTISGSAALSGLVCSTSSCSPPGIVSRTITIGAGASEARFFYRPNANLATGSLIMNVAAPGILGASSQILINLRVPVRVVISGGPASGQVDLGVCQAAPYSVDLLDSENVPVAPASPLSISISLAVSPGTGNFRTGSCLGTPLTGPLIFSAGEASKLVYFTARSFPTVTLSASASGLAPETKPVAVNRVPVSLSLTNVPVSVAAGVVSPITLSLLDGIDVPIPAPAGGVSVQLSGTAVAVGAGTFCASASCPASKLPGDRIDIAQGASQSIFHYQADPDASAGTRTLIASSNGLQPSNRNIDITLRVPVSVSWSGGPSGSVVLGQCQATSYSVNLLDGNSLPVGPAPSTTLTVLLDYSAGNGLYRSSCSSTTNLDRLVFSAGETSKTVFIIAQSSPSATLRAAPTNLTPVTRQITVERRALNLAVSGPSSIDAGRPSGPFKITVQDGAVPAQPIGAPAGGASATLTLPNSAVRAVFCASSDCAVRTPSPFNINLSVNQTEVAFYLLSDSDQSLSAQTIAVTSNTPSLTASSYSFNIVRKSLSLDLGFGTQGRVSLTALPGDVLTAVFSAGKLFLGGYSVAGGQRKMAVARMAGATGALDSGFGSNGVFELAWNDQAYVTALLPQGDKLLLAGVLQGSSSKDAFLMRLNADGSPDNSFRFRSGGLDPLSLPGDQIVKSLVAGNDGVLYVVGASEVSGASDLFIAAFSSEGVLRASEFIDNSGGFEVGSAALVQSVGSQDRIVIGGTAGTGSNQDFLFARVFGVRGSSASEVLALDSSFGSSGFTVMDLSQADVLRAMAVQPNGRIVAAGSSRDTSNAAISVACLSADGAVVSSFGDRGGHSLVDIALSVADRATSVFVDARTGSLYVAGSVDSDAFALRLGPNGLAESPSPSQARFSLNGSASTRDYYSIVAGPDGKPLMGTSSGGIWHVLGLLR
jgi:uncharacterized delta-60 repeat protein